MRISECKNFQQFMISKAKINKMKLQIQARGYLNALVGFKTVKNMK